MPSITGRVYDIDYLARQDWVQVLIYGLSRGIIVRRNERLESILLAAMLGSREVTVNYGIQSPDEIDDVSINKIAPTPTDNVETLSLSATGSCTATILDNGKRITSDATDLRCLLVLCFGIATKSAVTYVDANSGRFSRAKINHP